MKIIDLFELDENAKVLNKKEVNSNSYSQLKLFTEDYKQKEDKDFNISGQWIVLDESVKINNKYLNHLKNEENNLTWIKLPENYVEENYMVNYKVDDRCPLGIDVLIKEDGYPLGVISGCDSIKQAKVDNNLDGHKYKGDLGIKLNNDYFLTFNQENDELKIVKTNVDWDRGRRTI
ncbi:hypothetical protein C8C77_103207 [Halanaerobium saccharolyticum]|uniref:Uncharacterized protein n=1 Tax=Halanaerobium saccharolyticum TaxID=43595 RepID=A0A4R7Z8K1_9FIRM|nr:hypothetical protein [Halanaerobium saccharolyticum]RAK11219.1 hypothetical protein C7958_103207 [Halanaerobium saccharolyticum]TDW07070.1 hypothetical protein C8C77_103207 [Halanaerobium saccharolyticum]TDX63835.1 hypothetical protein C7956_102207 [Halanaerobium saccharolyticum]